MQIVVICGIVIAGVAFLVRFFVALCHDCNTGACHVVQILSGSGQCGINRTWSGAVESVPCPSAIVVAPATSNELETLCCLWSAPANDVVNDETSGRE